jgi:hypothetical protein
MVSDKLRKLDIYTEKLSQAAGFSVPQNIRASMNSWKYGTVAGKNLLLYLDSLKRQFLLSYRKARNKSDSLSRSFDLEYGRDWLVNLKNNYENRQLTSLVLGENNTEKIIETPDKFIRKYEPSLMKPESRNGRAHFYAPVKKLGSFEFDTFWFNTAVIWLVTLLFYIALYFKVLRKFVNLFENLGFRKSELDRLDFTIDAPV